MDQSTIINCDGYQVIQNSDSLYKQDVKWIDDIKPEPINQYEINMLKNTKDTSTLLKEEESSTTIQTNPRRDYITKVKVVAFGRLNIDPLTNGSFLSSKIKRQVVSEMEKILKLSEDQLLTEFNQTCIDDIFTAKSDYSTFPVYTI